MHGDTESQYSERWPFFSERAIEKQYKNNPQKGPEQAENIRVMGQNAENYPLAGALLYE